MGDRHDYVALEWVKGEIAETLKQARQALEAFVENPQDATRMRFCLTYVHQVHGTLQMVEFYGAALLAEEMEQLAQALMEGRVSNQIEALEVLMQAILQLPVYLERIHSARRDLPTVVLPLLNDLRAARGEKLLSETSLFSPNLSGHPPALSQPALDALRTAELPALLRKLRQMLQTALVGVIRNQDMATNLGHMVRVFARLEILCKDAPLGPLWQIAYGVVEGLANGSVVNGASVRTLLRQVDKELKRLVEQGADGINQAAPDELTKNLLFYVAEAPAQSPRIRALKEQYRLADALPDSDLVDEERARLSGPDRDAMRSVVGALCEELVRVKDSLDLFVRSDRKQVAELDGLRAPLKQIADTLAVLGFGQPRKVIVDQLDVVHGLSQGQREPSDAVLMDVAGALLYVEATLTGMVGPGEDWQSEQSHLPTTDVAQIHQLVIKEARTGLEQAKDAIIEFIASQWNHEHLAHVPELLTQVRGGLAMIPLNRAATLLEACNRYIQEQLLARKAVPNWQNLDTLADAITSVEYYLERLAEDHAAQGELILDVAEESLGSLGYPLKDKPSILERIEPATQSFAPLADPLHDIEVLASEQPHVQPEPEPEPPLAAAQPLEFAPLAADSSFNLNELSCEFTLVEQPAAATELLVSDDNWSLGAAENSELDAVIDLSLDAPLNLAEPLASLPTLELEELSPEADEAPSAAAVPEEQELSLDALGDEPLNWDAAQIAELDLPEIELATEPYTVEVIAPLLDKPLSMAEVMAAPVQAINPPAHDVPPSLLPPPLDEEPVDEELLEVFVEEAGEVLESIDHYLPQWSADPADKVALTEIRRAFHTLKGSGRMVRALVIGELGWSIENLLNRVLDRSIEATAPVQQVIQQVLALLPALVAEFAAKAQRQRDDVDLLAATAHALARGQQPPAVVTGEFASGVTEAAEPVSLGAEQDEQEEQEEALDPQLLEIFRNEAQTHLDALVGFLADCARELPQPVSDALQRALHTLKGSAYMAGILPIAEIATPLEKLVKEFKANLIPMDLAEAELLQRAEQLLRAGLAQLESSPLATIVGAAELLADVHKLHQQRLENVGKARQDEQGERRDPQLIALFLAEGMDILLDVEGLLRQWRSHPSEQQEISALLEELTTLARGAQMAELAQIDQLCQTLLVLYQAAQAGSLAVSERFFDEVEAAHEALIGMLDQVAAGLQVSAQPERGAALQSLLSETIDPAALGVIEVAEIELDNSTEKPSGATDAVLERSVRVPATEPRLSEPAATTSSVPESLDEEVLNIFLEEAFDIIESAGGALLRWMDDATTTIEVEALQRDLHTLKGGARMADIHAVGDLAHELEFLYEGVGAGRLCVGQDLFGLLQACHDRLSEMLEAARDQSAIPDAQGLITRIKQFRASPAEQLGIIPSSVHLQPVVEEGAAAEAPPEPQVPISVALSTPLLAASSQPQSQEEHRVLPFAQRAAETDSRRAPQELVKVPAELLEGLVNLAGETSIFRGRVEQQVNDIGFTLGEMDATIERVRDQLRRLDIETQAQILSRYQAEAERAGYEDFDPLEMDRHSQLQQLSRVLFESASDLLDLKETLAARNRDAETLLQQQARVNTELQEGLMRTRMVPFDRLVPRLRRIVRQVASELGKHVEFHVANAEGEMDRSVLERIVAPLEHMLRNAVDHGIEAGEVRRAAGKPEVGTIRLSLGREGGDILLTLADDGGGIKLEAVRRKAIDRGLMDADTDLTDHEILQFILEAGFSTAEKVTQISGRGVGMDVVHAEVKQLGGSMSIESTLGEGTRFLIRLPFTVSVNRALMVLSGEDLYAIPLNTIEGIVRVSPSELETYYAPGAPRFEYAGQAYELKYLGDLLNNGQQPKRIGQNLPLPVILVRSSEHAVAVQVDSLAGSREIVVKGLGPQFAGVHGISGATILGDGRVVVILDLLATIRVRHAHLLGQLQQPRLAGHVAQNAGQVEAERPTLVMVVDDSVTVRKVTGRLLERNGMNVLTAKDGVEAITQLQEHKPDIMLLDIEMPRMDGFEVASLVRHDERLKDLPIIMITSRTGAKHRERAMAIGVNEYLGKPYQESELLENIQKLVKRHDR